MNRCTRAALLILAAGAAAAALMLVTGRLRSASSERALGGYSTSLEGRSAEQLFNIVRAARRLDGAVVLPGREFSLAAVLGDTGPGQGWRQAQMIRGGVVEQAVAGGICQVSSTLYNAALSSGMQITERHAHSRPVASVPPGRDATLARGIADLRFRNGREHPVRIRAVARGERLSVTILGAGERPVRYRFSVEQRRLRGALLVSLWRTDPDGTRTMVSCDEYETARD